MHLVAQYLFYLIVTDTMDQEERSRNKKWIVQMALHMVNCH